MKKVLIITPRFPLPDTGACEKDRLEGVKQLKRLGFDVRVIGKVFSFQDRGVISDFSEQYGISVDLLEYEAQKERSFFDKIKFYARRFINPLYWDGAAYEYSHSATKQLVENILDEWRPDAVWFDYTYLWPLYGLVKSRKIPVITRSINFESSHFLQEDGYTFFNLIKSIPKFVSELIVAKKSDILFAITPQEEKIYKKLGAKNVVTLPLRGLPTCLNEKREIQDKPTLNAFFMGSTYTVPHNLKVLEFILKDIMPAMESKFPDKFIFHIIGRKFPPRLNKYLNDKIICHNFVDNLDEFLGDMDIAFIPSLFGAGMQQKIFESLCRGIPTVTSERGMADYPFKNGEHLLLARELSDFPNLLASAQDINLRKKLSMNSLRLCHKLFSQKVLDAIVLNGIRSA
ncbi:MAG: glycosyltransferase family 4 protein [Candidatus Niyogibacteria bacterium]|nr:glycosyltransferase family 4 protein [Candidatus Niyogibacteria bacterium]